ncbi:hypothetical protein TNIN_208301 [Trichonephila inaurata madagascariensis]|uniref:Uncharacterized protein n=1 Tax=Trichonephila inaurata madagascariensis TaxID=2747483 RepID=A0A8X7CSK4_9ARAC|nr:hypothetical protein TNIN_208301 [Trichonephila inaurata madagascariensis]
MSSEIFPKEHQSKSLELTGNKKGVMLTWNVNPPQILKCGRLVHLHPECPSHRGQLRAGHVPALLRAAGEGRRALGGGGEQGKEATEIPCRRSRNHVTSLWVLENPARDDSAFGKNKGTFKENVPICIV